MLVVLSDLHFQDTTEFAKRDGLNISKDDLLSFFRAVNGLAVAAQAKEIVFVLAGDIFDILHSHKWFDSYGAPTPYTRAGSDELEHKLESIYMGILSSSPDALEFLKDVAHNTTADLGFDFVRPPKFVYIPGNHDRHVRISRTLGGRIRELLSLDADDFARELIFPEYDVFIRHGQEYDWANCEYQVDGASRNPQPLYDEPVLGDWFAIDIVSRLQHTFRLLHSKSTLAESIYERLVHINDVRPLTSVLAWLKYSFKAKKESWKMVRGALEDTLREAAKSEFLNAWLEKHDEPYKLERIDFIQFLVPTFGKFSKRLPDALMEKAVDYLFGSDDYAPTDVFNRDKEFLRSGMKYLVHGHYHDSSIKFADIGKAVICTGSWRRRFILVPQRNKFTEAKTFNFAVFYRKDEKSTRTFEFWQGQGG